MDRKRFLSRSGSAVLCLLASAVSLHAGSVETAVVWVEGKPHAEVTVTAEPQPNLKEIALPLDLFDAQNTRIWSTLVKVPVTAERSWKSRVPLQNIKDPKKQHRLQVSLLSADLDIDYTEEVNFAAEAAVVQTHGLRTQGVFPYRKVFFVLRLNAFKGRDFRDLPVQWTLRDGDDNQVQSRQAAVKPAEEARRHLVDVTPDTSSSVGPYKLEVGIESDGYSVFFNSSYRFGHAGALVPVSGMEQPDLGLWFAAEGNPAAYRSLELYAPGQEQLYYSEHLRDLLPRDNPRVSYDTAVKRSGRQSLRLDYLPDREAHAWSTQSLPGKPTHLVVWVKGNNSKDQLVVHFEDNVNYTAPAWQRRAQFSSAPVCRLDFDGWRRFRVPVLGNGLQVTGLKGSTEKIDAPIRVMAFTVKPGPLLVGQPKDQRRSIWIDDLAVETQVAAAEMLSLELRTSDAAGRLTADGVVSVSVGNGYSTELKKGKCTVTARDGAGTVVWTRSADLPVPAESFAGLDVPLEELARKKPRGPVELEVTFQDTSRAGVRIARMLPLKAAGQGGLVFDFEEPVTFNGFQPGKVVPSKAKIVPGGAEGSGHALALPVFPGPADNSVLFHPALPGLVDGVEMMVQGGDRPVLLQVWFIDSGFTGVWLRPYNLFWAEPIKVDWQGWRKVVIPTPPIPAHQGDKSRYFFGKPWYPLNLALSARLTEGDQPTEIRIDNVRVTTHLPAAEQLRTEVEFPDETRLHPPGSPLRLLLYNFAASALPLNLRYKLTSYQGFVAQSKQIDVTLPAGSKQQVTLLDKLSPGIYDLQVSGLGAEDLKACIMVLNVKDYFGDDPSDLLTNSHLLRRLLNLTTERLYLDWDNSEPAPYLHHSRWFEDEVKKQREIPQLPKALQGLATRKATAAAAVVKTQQDLKKAQDQAAAVQNAVKPFKDKEEVAQRLFLAAKASADAIDKQLGLLTKQGVELAEKANGPEHKVFDAQEEWELSDIVSKAGAKALQRAEKAFNEAVARTKKAEDVDKATRIAATTAEKDVQLAEAALKAAQKEGVAKKIEEARARLQQVMKSAEMARTKMAEAREEAETRRQQEAGAKVDVNTARKELQTYQAQTAAAKQALEKAIKLAAPAIKKVNENKAEVRKMFDQLEAAEKKWTTLHKQWEESKAHWMFAQQRAVAVGREAATIGKALENAQAEEADATKALEAARSKYDFSLQPVVGFSADWAGPEAAETLEKGTFMRWIPNMLQVPRRMIDWSLFVRSLQREYKGRFTDWVFWENPDLDDAPQSIPPEKYAEMLRLFARWVKLYNPEGRVIAGGFNFHKSLRYLQRIPDVHKLPFDEIQVQVNLGELSPEHADLEGYLDDLNALLRHGQETVPQLRKRTVRITELDWAIGKYVTPMQQAAYHARAALILDSRGVPPHLFNLINSGFEFDGYGVFYRVPYGNTADLQTFLPYHVPKPSYFALVEARKFLADWKYVTGVNLSDRSLAHNRAFIYRNAAGELTAALWRAVDGVRIYRVPAGWRGVQARDVFGFPVSLDQGIPCAPLPTLLRLPAGYQLEQLLYDLRMLETTDGNYPVTLDLHLAEADSVKRAAYQSTGKLTPVIKAGPIAGDRKVRETFLYGLETESFSFPLARAGDLLLLRRWYFEGEGQSLHVRLNDGPEQTWALTKGQGNDPGPRESTFVLRGCQAGANRLSIRYDKPGNCSGYRLEPLTGDHVPLVRWGVLNTRQTRGVILKHSSAVGTPLLFGKTPCESGIGAHANSFIEYPLAGQFRTFKVTVGVDGSTEGRGSVVFRIFVDGKERANSGLITGFSKPKTLEVEGLEGAQRLILSVTDADDGNHDDLANWVDGKLYFKEKN